MALTLSDRDFEDISSKVENRFSKRLRDTEVNQREILKLIENLSFKVDNLANVNPGQNSLTFETGISEIPNDELEEVEPARSVNSNRIAWKTYEFGSGYCLNKTILHI